MQRREPGTRDGGAEIETAGSRWESAIRYQNWTFHLALLMLFGILALKDSYWSGALVLLARRRTKILLDVLEVAKELVGVHLVGERRGPREVVGDDLAGDGRGLGGRAGHRPGGVVSLHPPAISVA